MTRTILSKEPVDFNTRFFKSLVAPWVFLWVGLLSYFSLQIPYLWILTFLFASTFILMNYKAMGQFLMKVEIENDFIELTYFSFDRKKHFLKIPMSELNVEYYGNGKGISSLVSDHMRIEQNGKTILKQYKTNGWTLEALKETTEKLNELRKTKN